MDNFYTYNGENVNEFIDNYRNALQAQRDSAIKQLNQQRRNDYASYMGMANRRGMLYSNLPEREKVRYNVNTYTPSLVKIQSSYQSGLDTLRNNAVNLWNQIKAYEEAVQDISAASQ